MDSTTRPVVLVTGASGYVALHCIQQLLQAGYVVRGTIRNKKNNQKVQPLLRLPYAADRLELVEADLLKPDAWPKVVSGCRYILHVASPWPIIADASTVTTAVEGTLCVLRAAAKCPDVQKIVLTSSCAAVNDGHRNNEAVFNETFWTNLNDSKVEYYARSKTLAEKAAWDFWRALDESTRFDFTVLNPTFVVGPALSDVENGSCTIIGRIMSIKTFLAAPKACLGLVDVRDVARAHVLALTTQETNGERILINAKSAWFADIAKWLRKKFRRAGYSITIFTAPTCLLKIYAKSGIDPMVNAVMHRVGPELRFDNSKSKELLNITYIDPHQSIIDMMHSMIELGMVKKTKKYSQMYKQHNVSSCSKDYNENVTA